MGGIFSSSPKYVHENERVRAALSMFGIKSYAQSDSPYILVTESSGVSPDVAKVRNAVSIKPVKSFATNDKSESGLDMGCVSCFGPSKRNRKFQFGRFGGEHYFDVQTIGDKCITKNLSTRKESNFKFKKAWYNFTEPAPMAFRSAIFEVGANTYITFSQDQIIKFKTSSPITGVVVPHWDKAELMACTKDKFYAFETHPGKVVEIAPEKVKCKRDDARSVWVSSFGNIAKLDGMSFLKNVIVLK